MYPKGWVNGIRYSALGAVAGWLFGTFAWALNELHLRDLPPGPDFITIEGGHIIHLAAPFPPGYGFIALLCMLTFSVVSYGVHRIVVKPGFPLLLLWQIIGLISLALLLTFAQLGWEGLFFSPTKGWVVILGLVAALVSNFIIGVVVESAAKVYTRPSSGPDNCGGSAA